jgi:hypothetical protein
VASCELHTEWTVRLLLQPAHKTQKIEIRMVAGHCNAGIGDGVEADDARVGHTLQLLMGYLLESSLEDFLAQIDIVCHGRRSVTWGSWGSWGSCSWSGAGGKWSASGKIPALLSFT